MSIKGELNKVYAKTIGAFLDARYKFANQRSNRSVVDPKGAAIVSMTTFGQRTAKAHLTIESIANGSVLPKRMILWIDEQKTLEDLPIELERLKKRGLEILPCENLGSFKKFFPLTELDISSSWVTADDDVFYPKEWLAMLVNACKAKKTIYALRVQRITLNDGKIAPHNSWNFTDIDEPSVLNFATGVNGVIYPSEFLHILCLAGRGFLNCCPKADDVWLHKQAIANGYKIAPIGRAKTFFGINGSQATALHRFNVKENGNDPQIAATYSNEDIELLIAEDQTRR
ncbi:hypothetical protein AGMMS50229_10410 [Campylobacterota bacterium]|nr:hypothetical protein AGMMS50229_10410 [Campylobacterota bacterium]